MSTATAPVMPTLLELRGVDVSYGPYRALFGVSFSVPAGSAVALVGPNGAGKTSVARVVSGLVHPQRGEVTFAGCTVTRWQPWRIARAGLLHVPEGRSVMASLTVEENLELALDHIGRRGDERAGLERAYGLFGHLADRRHQLAGTLSGGEQRMLALARAVALPRRLLVVDELSLGLAPSVVDELFGVLRSIVAEGTSLLLIEQHVEKALELADRVVVLVRGQVAVEGATSEVAALAAEMVMAPTGAR